MNVDVNNSRFNDLANTAYLRGIPTFTEFLDLHQQTEYFEFIMSKKMPPIKTCLNGGLICVDKEIDKDNSFIERKIACFYPDDLKYEFDYPIRIIKIQPVNAKFSDSLNHRDFLGAIMNLGIERHMIGDILVSDNKAFVFVIDKLASYVCDNLFRIKHTSVTSNICDSSEVDYIPLYQELKGSVASERLDAIISFGFNLSRNEASLFISSGKVFINGRETCSKSHMLKYGDIVSVRGKGRFVFDEVVTTTKKGRFFIKIRKYI